MFRSLLLSAGLVCSICPPEWQKHNSNCYFFSKEVLSWDGAQDYCQEFGGYLTEITTREENSYIEQMSKQNYHPNRTTQGEYIYGLVCPPDWQHHDNSCYFFSNDTLPWDGAQEYCQEFGGYLAELTTTEENNYIEQMSKHYYHPNSTAQGDYIYGYWTGGEKNMTDGYWYWPSSGQKITLTNWAYPEPNDLDGKENCIHINSNEGFKWNDYVCTQNEYFICEKSKDILNKYEMLIEIVAESFEYH
ncbi:unnamed protein product [Mytilus coruscus]|uniref:C-type lectin domain-containing protein n=1 Tax=Mytilus coruscus TaxID=42192 RepID=A0A6J8ACV2_MYTCO|nr:unnamed protein product [Mytilus coruscus]